LKEKVGGMGRTMDPFIDNRNRRRKPGPVVSPHPIDPYPRNRAAVVRGFVGRKVTVSTTDFHYLVGRLIALGDDDMLVLHVRGEEVRLRRGGLATIQVADEALAEYVK
jgi:hypothetical protein